jgi:hypothetical protein
MSRLILGLYLALLTAALAVVGCGGADSTTVTVTSGSGSSSETASTETSTTETSSEPDLDQQLASCDDQLSGGYKLIGSVQVTNNGDTPQTATVAFKWQLGDGSFVNADQNETIQVQPGQDQLAFFSKSVPGSVVDGFQNHPGYFDSTNCEFTVSAGGG